MSSLIGQQAPDFIAPAVLGTGEIVDEFDFSKARSNRYTWLFFYPLDFTFVCPSELIALDHRLDEFKNQDVEIITVSVDSHYTHNAWRNTPIENGGIGEVGFTMVADVSHRICQAYGIELEESGVALRGSFLIDRSGIVRHTVINDLPLGRNIDEMFRMVDALQFHEEHGEVCPAGWQRGDAAMRDTPEGVADYLQENAAKL